MAKYQILWNEKKGVWEPAYAMNKDQKELFSNLDLKEEDLQQQIASVIMKNADNHSEP